MIVLTEMINRVDAKYNAKTRTVKREHVDGLIRTFFAVFKDALDNEEIVTIKNVGKFEPKVRKPKKGRNPKTGETVMIPDRRYIKFKAAPALIT